MAKLVFDIETSALPLIPSTKVQQEYLFRDAGKLPDEGRPRKPGAPRSSNCSISGR